jgi:hypothetical protein
LTDPDAPIPTWTVPSTMFHEGVPGHHLQLGVTTLNTATLNRFQRLACELHLGHCEGWGLYAERLMDELGYFVNPAHRMGMLAGGQQLRAARVVLDIGLHLRLPIPAGTGFHEGERWTPRLGREFLTEHCGLGPPGFVEFEIDRYLGRPGQALAYKLGEKVWLEARDAARRRDGAVFDLKQFHHHALDLGPMGLDLLRAELTRKDSPARSAARRAARPDAAGTRRCRPRSGCGRRTRRPGPRPPSGVADRRPQSLPRARHRHLVVARSNPRPAGTQQPTSSTPGLEPGVLVAVRLRHQ